MADLWQISPAAAIYALVLAALLGAVLASFSGCAAVRLARGESFLKGRSHCDACGHVLGPLDLVPIFSWLLLGGKCRYCKSKIPASGFVSEVLEAAAFAAIVWRYGLTARTAEYLILTALLAAIALVDWQTGLVPDSLLAAICLNFALFTLLARDLPGLGRGVLGGLMLLLPLLGLSLVMDRVLGRDSMGGGDLKLYFAVGLYFPWSQLLVVVIASCLVGILLALLSQKTTGDPDDPKAFPFAPAIAAAAVGSLLWAQPLVDWYLGLF